MERVKALIRKVPFLYDLLSLRKIVTDPRFFFTTRVKPWVADLCVRCLRRLIQVPALTITRQECVVDAGVARFAWRPGDPYSLLGYPLHGTFEGSETRIARAIARQSRVIFDVGGNFGWFAALFKNEAPEGARIHVFEPVPSARRELLHNLELNPRPAAAGVEVRVMAQCVSDRPGKVGIFVPKRLGSAFASLKVQETFQDGFEEIQVEATTLDEHCAREGIAALDFLKIDVEGAEGLVLQGASRLLSGESKPAIMVEIAAPYAGTFGHSFADIAGFLAERGYEAFEITETDLVPVLASAVPAGYNFLFLPSRERFRHLFPR